MSDKKEKKPKKKGPIRVEAVVPAAILFGLFYAYGAFFFDSHLRSGLSWTATQIHGAEVNIRDIDSSFFGGYFHLFGLEVTDPEKPERNLLSIGAMKFSLLWDALLRAKFVVNEASIENIQAMSPRKRPGRVLPKTESGPNKELEALQKGVIDQTKETYNDNILGDLASIAGGVNPEDQLKNIQSNLKTEKRIQELELELKKKEKEWKSRMDSLPRSKELKDIEQRAKALKFDGKNLAKSLKEVKKLSKEVKQKLDLYKKTSKALKADLKNFENQVQNLEKLAEEDLKDLQGKFKIPTLDAKAFTMALFARMFGQKLATVRKYSALAQEYMPPKKSKEVKAEGKLVPRKRSDGVNIKFPITVGYPLFWLQKASISSEPNESEYSGRIRGEVLNVTSNPKFIQKPATIEIEGDFPKQKILAFNTNITLDHTKEVAEQNIVGQVGSFPVGKLELSKSKEARFIIQEATGRASFSGKLKEGRFQFGLNSIYDKVNYDVGSKQKIVDEILKATVRSMPNLNVKASASGTWDQFDLDIDSNLGRALGRGLKQQVQVQIDKAKQKLKNYIDDKIKGQKAKLEQQFKSVTSGVEKELNSKKQEIDNVQKGVESQAKNKQNKEKKKIEKKGKKLMKDLKKSLGF